MSTIEAQQSGLRALACAARLHDLTVDPQQLFQQFIVADTSTPSSVLLRAAKKLKLKARAVQSTSRALADVPLPAVALMDDDRYCVLVRRREQGQATQFLVLEDGATAATIIEQEDFNARFTGELVLLTKRFTLKSLSQKFDISWFLPALLKYKGLFGQVLLASFFIQLFALITPLFFQVVIDKVLVHQGLTTLDVLCFGLLVIAIFDVLMNGLRNYVFAHTTSRVDVTLGAKLFDHLMRLPISFFHARQVGTTVARVRELDTVRDFITSSALILVVDLGFLFIFFAVLYVYSPTLTWIVLGSLPLYILVSALVTPILRKKLNEKFERGAENQAFLVESVSGAETLKSLAIEPRVQKQWEDQLAAYVSASFQAVNLGNIANQSAALISKLVTAAILWVGASLVIAGSMSVGQLIAFNMIAGRVSAPILKLVQLWQDFQQAGISVARLADIMNTPTEPSIQANRTALPDMRGEVRLEQVTFRYQPDRAPVLNNFALSVAAGSVIGLVGKSGSGKSTLTKLLQRLYVPESGRVLIDGVDLAQVDTAWLRRQLGVVLQDNILFNRSVRENISLGEPGMPMDQVIRAAKLAGAHDFILALSEGYDTVVGEQGALLSGGQRQRIAIARALIQNPRILILDEATSALDYESERIIQHNMAQICAGRTVFIIAHRLSTVRAADQIIVVEEGRNVEQGTHQELIDLGGHYARLNEYQAGAIKDGSKKGRAKAEDTAPSRYQVTLQQKSPRPSAKPNNEHGPSGTARHNTAQEASV